MGTPWRKCMERTSRLLNMTITTSTTKTTKTSTMLPLRPGTDSRDKPLEAPSQWTTQSQLKVLTKETDFLPSFEQKKDMEAHVGNMTCVLRETNVLNKENEIDVKSLRRAWSNTPCQAH